jgi:hypothetical protein
VFTCHPGSTLDTQPASANATAGTRRNSPETEATEGGCARQIITSLVRRAYRRAPTDADVDPLIAF